MTGRDATNARDFPTPSRTAAAADVETALAELPEEYRSAILLVDVEELTYEEAAAALGCPVGTIPSTCEHCMIQYAPHRGQARKHAPPRGSQAPAVGTWPCGGGTVCDGGTMG